MHVIGIIGYGDMGRWHAENIRDRISGLSIGGVYDIKPERCAKAVSDGLKVYGTLEELLSDERVDLVLVATPNNFHKQHSIAAMLANKNVVCEKPVCLNLHELQDILAVANATKKLFTVHQNRRWDIDFAVVKRSLQDGIVGDAYFIDSRLYGSKGLPGDWRSVPEAGGGMLFDWGVHLIDQMLCLDSSKVVSVYCQMLDVKFTKVDDCDRIILEFESGMRAHIVVDSWCYISDPRWHISGHDGTLVVSDWFSGSGKIIKANIKEINWEEGVIFTSAGRTRTMAPRPKESLEELAPIALAEPRWEEFYENIMAVIEGKAQPIVTHNDQIRLMQVMDACRKSGTDNCVVKL